MFSLRGYSASALVYILPSHVSVANANIFLPVRIIVVLLQIENNITTMIGTNTIPSANIADMYMSVLSSLSVDDRLDLIAKLSSSIKNATSTIVADGDLRTMFCGEWGDVEELRDRNYAGREVLNW